tara:strand:+ start:474 stop:1046 length:573 start_codon:yes stop_codon:yes gene_type:complete
MRLGRNITKSMALTLTQSDVVEYTALLFLDRKHYVFCWNDLWQERVSEAAIRSLTDMPFWYAIQSSLIEEPFEALYEKIEVLDNVSRELPGVEKPSLTAAKLLGGDGSEKNDLRRKNMGVWSFFEQFHALEHGAVGPVDMDWLFVHYPWVGTLGSYAPQEHRTAVKLVQTRIVKVMFDAFNMAWEVYRKR